MIWLMKNQEVKQEGKHYRTYVLLATISLILNVISISF